MTTGVRDITDPEVTVSEISTVLVGPSVALNSGNSNPTLIIPMYQIKQCFKVSFR